MSWKAEDGRRLSATVLNSYAELLAIQRAHPEHSQQAGAQMKQLKSQLVQLIGEEQTTAHIRQLEDAQEQRIASSLAEQQVSTSRESRTPLVKKGFLDSNKKTSKKRNPPSSPPVSPDPGNKYRNWALAHQLSAPDKLELPPAQNSSELDHPVREAVLRVMDERLSSEIKNGVHTMLRANLLELREMITQLVPNRADLIREIEQGLPVVSGPVVSVY